MLALWFAITGSGLWPPLVQPAFLPSPVTVAKTFMRLAATGYQGHTLLHHFLISLMRFGVAFAICVVIGVPVGLLMGMHSGVRAVLDPPIETTRPIPSSRCCRCSSSGSASASCRRRSSSSPRSFR